MKRVVFDAPSGIVRAKELHLDSFIGIQSPDTFDKYLLIPVYNIEGLDWALLSFTYSITECFDGLQTALKELDSRGLNIYSFSNVKSMREWFVL